MLRALAIRVGYDEPTLRDALGLLPADGRGDLLLLAALLVERASLRARRSPRCSTDLEFTAADRDRVVAALLALPRLLRELPAAPRASGFTRWPRAPPSRPWHWPPRWRTPARTGTRRGRTRSAGWESCGTCVLQINGDDLIEAGVPQGPEIGRRLRAVLERRLDGELAEGREAELRAALEGG